MSQIGESFTLLESGTSRLHFRLVKALEDSRCPVQEDLIILETVAQIRAQLVSPSRSSNVAKLSSSLLTLLHCLHCYPCSAASLSGPSSFIDVTFALIPTLQLLSLATNWKHLLLAYHLLPILLPCNAHSHPSVSTVESWKKEVEPLEMESQEFASASTSSRPPSSISRGPSSYQPPAFALDRGGRSDTPSSSSQNIDNSSSLLLLNTIRTNLTAAAEQVQHGSPRFFSGTSSRSRTRSPSTSRSTTNQKLTSSMHRDAASVRVSFRAMTSLRLLATGTPQGPAVLPSLASTLVALTRHPEASIRSMTLNAMLSSASVTTSVQADKDGQLEMLDAALTIVRLTLASTYAFSPGSDLDEQQGLILSEMERRVDANPGVLRSCVRVLKKARSAGILSDKEAACHAIEVLQASRWAPMHLEVPALQQQRIPPTVVVRTEGIRARTASQHRVSLISMHDYHGSYAPWLVEACLSLLTESVEGIQGQSLAHFDKDTGTELLTTVLRIYNVASQGKATALALCVAAARCTGVLYPKMSGTSAMGRGADGEVTTLWSTVSTHIKSQLCSSNPNRRIAGLSLLEALLPVGWAHNPTRVEFGPSPKDAEHQAAPHSPLEISEVEMGKLMALLADEDTSIRKRAQALLHRVDRSLTELLRTQLQAAVDSELGMRTSKRALHHGGPPAESVIITARRLIEVALFAASSIQSDISQAQETAEEAISALERSLISGIALGLFASFERKSYGEQGAWEASTVIGLGSLRIEQRLGLLRRLAKSHASIMSSCGLLLFCKLLCDLSASEFRKPVQAGEEFIEWVGTELLSAEGFSGLLVQLPQDSAGAAREAILGVAARTLSLTIQIVWPIKACADLCKGLETLRTSLAKLVETESQTTLRTQASNLQLICQTLVDSDPPHDGVLIDKFRALATSCQTIKDAVRYLLELQLVVSLPSSADEAASISSINSGSSLLATATQFFSPSSGSSPRSAPSSDSFAALRLRSQLPDFLLHSSRLLSPNDSTVTLRSSKNNSRAGLGKSREGPSTLGSNLATSAIPSESKRLRDRSIAEAMSESIAKLVLGSDAKGHSSDNEVIFSATSSGVLEGEELELIDEVADRERCLNTVAEATQKPSLLDLVHQCHNYDPWLDTSLTPFVLDGVQIGFLPARVVKACVDDSADQRRAGRPAVLRQVRFAMHHREILPPTASLRTCEAITFTSDFATPEARTTGLNAVAQRWRQARLFPDPLDGWRDELYAIYGLNPQPGSRNPIAFKLERAACALFGFATFGVHLTAYTIAPGTGELKVWVPQRSSTKSTWPGYLDNSVAGGIVAGDLPMESMVRECEEEANLKSALVEKHIKQTGVLSYCYKTPKQGWIQPEVEYVYDLPLPVDVTLQPKDGEVDHFELMNLTEIYEKMRQGKFKANCVLVMLDFLIRHGHVTADSEPGYRQIVAQLHVDLRLPGP